MSPVDLKIVLLGKECCGKTSLVERFIYNRFRGDLAYQNTIGAAFGAKKIEVDGEMVTVGVWDTAGSERYEAMCRIYYRDAGAAILCFDLTSTESFERTKFWVDELRKYEPSCKIYLCGTKFDLLEEDRKRRKIDFHNTTDYAEEIQAEAVFETSSKTDTNVSELFLKIAQDYVQNKSMEVENGLEKLSLDNSARTNALVPRYSCC